jgi:hypothetical protein
MTHACMMTSMWRQMKSDEDTERATMATGCSSTYSVFVFRGSAAVGAGDG